MSDLSQTAEDYLETILIVKEEMNVVRVRDIAHYMKVKKPSVVSMIKKLSQKELIKHEHYGYIELTKEGLLQAKAIYERHKTLFHFLHHILSLDAATAKEDACKIEHYLNPKTLDYIVKFIEFVETCPEGEPLWLSNFHYFAERGVRPEHCKEIEKMRKDIKMSSNTLKSLKVGQKCRVKKISGAPEIKRRLLDMGIVPGVEIKVEKVAPLGDPVDVTVKGYHLSLRKEEASCVGVEVLQ